MPPNQTPANRDCFHCGERTGVGGIRDWLEVIVERLYPPAAIDLGVIDGRVRIEHGEFAGVDLPALIAAHNAAARALVA